MLGAMPARGEVRWTGVKVDADLLADGTVEYTEVHVLVASGSSFEASRWLDVRSPAVPTLVEVALLEPGGERKLREGSLWEADCYTWNGAKVTWALRPGNADAWEAPTTLKYRLRWKAAGAVTPVWAPRPAARPMPGRPLRERLAVRWAETREALERAGPKPFRRYVLDLNVAAPSREGPIEALDYGLAGDNAWTFAGNFRMVTIDRALPSDEGIDLSFLFDRAAAARPEGVDVVGPAALVGLALGPVAAGLWLLGKTLLAWRKRKRAAGEAAPPPAPDRPEAMSPEIFASLFGEGPPLAPMADEVWTRLRDEKAVVLDRQDPPNLVLRADPSDLRPPEAALVRLLFGERGAVPLAEAREAAKRFGDALDEAVDRAFDAEVDARGGAEQLLGKPRPGVPSDAADLFPTIFVLGLVPLALGPVAVGWKVAGAAAAFLLAAVFYRATRLGRDAGLGPFSVLIPAGGSLLLAAALLATTYLHPEPIDLFRSFLLSGTALLLVRAGFIGARPGEGRKESPLRLWALEQREALRERLLRAGGEVEPAEAPWFRAAGLEVSLSEPGVAADDMEEVLGVSSGEDEPGESKA